MNNLYKLLVAGLVIMCSAGIVNAALDDTFDDTWMIIDSDTQRFYFSPKYNLGAGIFLSGPRAGEIEGFRYFYENGTHRLIGRDELGSAARRVYHDLKAQHAKNEIMKQQALERELKRDGALEQKNIDDPEQAEDEIFITGPNGKPIAIVDYIDPEIPVTVWHGYNYNSYRQGDRGVGASGVRDSNGKTRGPLWMRDRDAALVVPRLEQLYRQQQTELNKWLRDQGHSIRQSGY